MSMTHHPPTDADFIALCRLGVAADIETALAAGANVNARDFKKDETALMAAAWGGKPEAVRVLLAAGAEVDARDSKGRTALMRALQSEIKALESFLFSGIKDPDAQIKQGFANAFAEAYSAEGPEMVQALLDAGADVNARDNEGHTPLMMAEGRSIEVLQALLAAGAQVNVRNEKGETPLLRAVSAAKDPQVIAALLAAGADVTMRDQDERTVLMRAAGHGNVQTVQTLLDAGCSVHDRDRIESTALLWAAFLNKDVGVLRLLLEAGADLHAVNCQRQNALMLAARKNSREMVTALLEAGADLHAFDHRGCNALMLGAEQNSLEVVQALLAAGAQVNDQLLEPADTEPTAAFPEAEAEAEDEDEAEPLPAGPTALMQASFGNKFEVVEALLDAGADATAVNENSDTALHWASGNNDDPAVVQRLVLAGAEVDAQNDNGQTPLMLASRYNRHSIVATLLALGADPALYDDRSHDALWYATRGMRERDREAFEDPEDHRREDRKIIQLLFLCLDWQDTEEEEDNNP